MIIEKSIWRGIGIGISALFLIVSAAAQDKDPCYDPQTQLEINACAAERYKEADAELNKVYKQVMTELSKDRKTQLKAAQIAWIEFRDAHCQFKSAEYHGGSLYPTLYHDCLTAMTEFRTLQLREELENISAE